MKARVKATGEIIEVSRHSGVMDDINKRIYNWYEIETIDAHFTDNYWEKLKHQYAGMAMQGLMTNSVLAAEFRKDPNNGIADMSNTITKAAVIYATALVEKLKSESNGN